MRKKLVGLIIFLVFGLSLNIITYAETSNTNSSIQAITQSRIVKIAAGYNHTVALKNDGTVWTWGCGLYGQLGDGTEYDRPTPIQVPEMNNVISVAAGFNHTVVLRNDGTVWAWGHNEDGELGNNSKYNSATPVQVYGISDVKEIGSVAYHVLALKNDGTIWSWGTNGLVERPNNDEYNIFSTNPKFSGVTTSVVAGEGHTVSIGNNGTVLTWGRNNLGQLGNGIVSEDDIVESILVPGISSIVAVAAGKSHTVALESNGIIWSWGDNSHGQLGTMNYDAELIPIQTQPKWLKTMFESTNGVVDSVDSSIKYMGTWSKGIDSNYYGSTKSEANITDSSIEMEFTGDKLKIYTDKKPSNGKFDVYIDGKKDKTIDTYSSDDLYKVKVYEKTGLPGGRHKVWLKLNGQKNEQSSGYYIGLDYFEYDTTAMQLNLPYLAPKSVVAGEDYTMVLTENGSLYAWGLNLYNECSIPESIGRVKAITGGNNHCVAIKDDGTVVAWGRNDAGQCDVPENLTDVKAVAAGRNFSLALKSDGTLVEWGKNISVSGLRNVIAISAAIDHFLALKDNGTVVAFGDSGYNRTDVPKNLSNVKSIAAGTRTSFAVKEDGTVVAWGEMAVPSDLTNVVAISAGNHVLALKENGTIVAWGNNEDGQSSVTNVNTSKNKIITCGPNHSVVIKEDGTVFSWGSNRTGQCNVPLKFTVKRPPTGSIPAPIPNIIDVDNANSDSNNLFKASNSKLPSGPKQALNKEYIIKIAAGYDHTLALKNDGTVWAWGCDLYGQLGDGKIIERYTPEKVPGISDVIAIAGGWYHSVVLKSDGTVWVWGNNSNGQLGNNSRVNSLTPLKVQGITDVKAIAAGKNYTLALKNDGTVWAWGCNVDGQCGNAVDQLDILTPRVVVGISDVASITAGEKHTVVIKNDGNVWCWGTNYYGTLGYGKFTTSQNPRAPGIPVHADGMSSVVSIAAGNDHSLSLRDDGSVWVWGRNGEYHLFGQAHAGKMAWSNIPVYLGIKSITPKIIDKVTGGITAIAAGEYHSLALDEAGVIWAWGQNQGGQLGHGTVSWASPYFIALSDMSGVVAISAGQFHSVALKNDGTVWTWGMNNHMQLGIKDGQAYDSHGVYYALTPVQVDSAWIISPQVVLSKDHEDSIVKDSDNVVITATFSKDMENTPVVNINVPDADADIVNVAMTKGADDKTWSYSWNVPSGHDGEVVVTVAGNDTAGNAYAGRDKLTFTIDNNPEFIVMPLLVGDTVKYELKTDILANKIWTIRLNRKIDVNTIGNIYVAYDVGGTKKIKSIEVKIGDDASQVKVHLDGKLPKGTYYLIVRNDLKNEMGKVLYKNVVMPFQIYI